MLVLERKENREVTYDLRLLMLVLKRKEQREQKIEG